MCFGGSKTAPPPTPPSPGQIGPLNVEPDYSKAHLYRGNLVGEDTSGRYGGELLTGAMTADEASKSRSNKTLLGA